VGGHLLRRGRHSEIHLGHADEEIQGLIEDEKDTRDSVNRGQRLHISLLVRSPGLHMIEDLLGNSLSLEAIGI
jgi:hypothetical protein